MNLDTLRIYLPIVLYPLLLWLLIGNLFSNSYAIDSSFARQNVEDPPLDWINIDKQTTTSNGDPSTDIVEVTYGSSGNILNSTIWLLFPFRELPIGYGIFNYGILIDSDFDEDTGAGGIDYQLEIKWNNQTKTWTRVLTEWSSSAVGGRILEETKNFTAFSGDNLYYVSLPINLEDFLNLTKFRAIYYAESKKDGGPLSTDFTKWINVPPPEIKLTTYPESVKLRQGESKTIELLINSTPGLQPDIMLSSKNQSSGPVLDFKSKNFTIPSDGFASIPLTVKTSSDTGIGPYTIFIFANSTFPSLEFVKVNTSSSQGLHFPFEIQGEGKIADSSLLIEIEEPVSLIDQVSEYWTKLGQPLSFLYGFLAGASPVVYRVIKKKLTK
jgi:hypothetical protein